MTELTIPRPIASRKLPHLATERTVAIRIDGLTKQFPDRRTWPQMLRHPFSGSRTMAVSGVSCEILTGELFGLLGPNGAGKTTLFKMLAASTTPDSGTATILGYDAVSESSAVRRVVSCVYASERNLYWRLSARENLKLWASLNQLYGDVAKRRIEEVLERVEIADTGEKIVAMFSSGMRQRLLLARALLSGPKVLLLDEPTRSLDPISARSFRQLLRQITSGDGGGCTVILATHSSEEAMELCDRVAILDHGRLLALGTSKELSQRFGDHVYCLWTRNPDHPAILMLDAEGKARTIDVTPDGEKGWYCVRLAIAGDMTQSTEILSCLTASGVDIARFEQKNLSLAELIERVVKSSLEVEER